MADETQVVETAVDETASVDTATGSQDVDYQAELTAKEEELNKVRIERDNYRKGMLKAKGKIPDDYSQDDDKPDLDDLVAQKVQEALLATKEAQIEAEKQQLLAKMAKENSELKIALANRSQVGSGGTGANQDGGMEVKNQFFSDAQIADLKKRGWDDEKIDLLRKNVGKATPSA